MRSPYFGVRRTAQGGTAAVEFALVSVILFSFIFGTMELARALYMWNTLAEVVNRAARMAAFSTSGDATKVRQQAMFQDGAGALPLGGGINDTNWLIEYLAANQSTVVAAPTCPVQNLVNCTNAPLGPSCIRFVRVRLCMPNTNCEQITYQPMAGLDALNAFKVKLPTFATVVPAESLGLPADCTE